MREVLEELRNIHQAFFCGGNVHSEDENRVDGKFNIFINRLSDTIWTVVTSYQETVERCELTFESFAHFSKSEDDVYRSKERSLTHPQIEAP